MTYRVEVLPGVQASLDRLREADHVGAALIVGTFAELAADPRPGSSHLLNETEGLHLLRLSRLEATTGRTLRYQVVYQVRDGDLVIVVVTATAVPRPSRRRQARP